MKIASRGSSYFINVALRMIGAVTSASILLWAIVDKASFSIDRIIVCYFILAVITFLTGITSGNKFFMTSYFWFLGFCFIYQTAYPTIFYYGGFTFYGIVLNSISYCFLYSLKFICCVLFAFFVAYNKFMFIYNSDDILKIYQNDGGYSGLLIVAAVNFALELYGFIFGGNLAFILSGSTSRIEINKYLSTTDIWGFVGYINLYLLIVLILRVKSGNKPQGTALIVVDIIAYITVALLTGSRKFVLYVMIILIMFYVIGIFESRKPLILGGIIVLVATYQRVVVFDGGLHGNIYRKLAGMFGEFIFPSITFPLCYQRRIGISYFNYPTYLDSFLYFIPRSIFPEKNHSIATIFTNYMNEGMGFSSSPLLEGFINCGDMGWLVEAILVIVILYLISVYSRKNFVLYMFGIILLVDLNRGEVAYFFRRIIEMSVTIYVSNWVSKKIIVKK